MSILHHTLMSQYKHGTASGIGSVSYESVANCVTPEVVIYGKCVQNGTPTPDAPVDIVCNNNTYKCHGKNLLPFPYATSVGSYVRGGVTFTINEDGSITIKGTAGANANVTLLESANLGQANIDARFTDSKTNGEYAVSKYLYYKAETGVLTVNVGYGDYVDETIYPQVERGKIISTYDPYFDGGTVIAPELLSVGGKSDEYNPQTGKIIRRCKKITLDASMDMTIKKWVDGELGISFTNAVPNSGASVGNTMCSHEDSFDTIFSSLGYLGGHVMNYVGNSTNLVWYGILDALGMTTIAEFKEWLTAQSDAGTPVTVVYKLSEPVIEYVEPTPFISKRSVITPNSFNPVLKAVGDVKDEYNPLTGEYIRRCQTQEVKASWQYPPDGSPSLEKQGKSFCFDVTAGAMGYNTSICTHFENVDNAWLGDYKDRYGIYSDHPTVTARYFRAPNESITTVAEFTAWLLEQDKAGTPVLLTYVLAEPISGIVSGDVTIIEEDANSAVTDTQIDVKYLTHS